MTTTLRPLWGIAFAAVLAISLITTTIDAVASTPQTNSGPAVFDQGFFEFAPGLFHARPLGRRGISWE